MTSAVKRSSACLCCSASPAKALSGLTGGASVFFGNNIMVGVFSAIILNALFVALPDLVAKHRAPASVDVPAADPADGTGAAAYDER